MKAKELTFEDIAVGDSASFTKVWTREDVLMFASLSGDMNPLHVDENYALATQFGKPIIHGMLVASSFSSLVGMYLPGKYCLYVKQDVSFKKPVYTGDTLIIEGRVVAKIQSTKMLEIKMKITRVGEVVVEGTALVQVLAPYE